MADIRIKDLTTLESASLTGDVFVIDGTTGTRKLSAFSPTFGGNATVTGTLTVNGIATVSAGAVIGEGTFGAGKIYTSATGGLSLGAKTGSSYDFILATPSGANLIAYVPTGTDRLVVPSTSASTTTSTGALVVSGGLGVGGAIYAGGTQGIVNNVSGSNDALLSVKGASQEWQFRLIGATGNLAIYNSTSASSPVLISPSTGNAIFGSGVSVTTTLSVNGTTASTSTSSGALVVSGGVGVAGKVNAGSFGTTGITLSAVQSVSVSTTAVDIAASTEVGGLYFVTGYNNADGAQGSWLVMIRGTAVTTISSDNNTGLTVTFSVRTSGFTRILQAATASGTLITNATAFTR